MSCAPNHGLDRDLAEPTWQLSPGGRCSVPLAVAAMNAMAGATPVVLSTALENWTVSALEVNTLNDWSVITLEDWALIRRFAPRSRRSASPVWPHPPER